MHSHLHVLLDVVLGEGLHEAGHQVGERLPPPPGEAQPARHPRVVKLRARGLNLGSQVRDQEAEPLHLIINMFINFGTDTVIKVSLFQPENTV